MKQGFRHAPFTQSSQISSSLEKLEIQVAIESSMAVYG